VYNLNLGGTKFNRSYIWGYANKRRLFCIIDAGSVQGIPANLHILKDLEVISHLQTSIKYWNNLRTQQSIFSTRFHCALLTLHVSAPFCDHLQVVSKHKKISKVVTIYSTDPLSRHV
jgi:hypothetical protein